MLAVVAARRNERLSTVKPAGRNRLLSAEIRPRRDSLRQSERLSAKRITSFGIEMVPSADNLSRILEFKRGDFCFVRDEEECL